MIKVKPLDKDGNELKCSYCDKPCGMSITGSDRSINYCADHSPFGNPVTLDGQPIEARFVYTPRKKKEAPDV